MTTVSAGLCARVLAAAAQTENVGQRFTGDLGQWGNWGETAESDGRATPHHDADVLGRSSYRRGGGERNEYWTKSLSRWQGLVTGMTGAFHPVSASE